MRIVFIIAVTLSLIGCNRKDSITKFSEENEMDKEYYVYPSTLRMANLNESEEFNEAVEEFVMGKYFRMSNTSENSILIEELKAKMKNEGYEEAMSIKNKDQHVEVYVLERKVPLISAIFEEDSSFSIAQVEGIINIAKIPEFLKNYDNDDYINLLDFIQSDQNSSKHEHHSQD